MTTNNPYNDHIESAKIQKPFDGESEKYKLVMTKKAIGIDDNSYLIKSLKVNGTEYKQGLLIKNDSNFYEIEFLLCNSDNFYLLTNRSYKKLKFDEFFNSLVLETNSDILNIFQLKDLKQEKQSYEKVILNGQMFVKCNNLHLAM